MQAVPLAVSVLMKPEAPSVTVRLYRFDDELSKQELRNRLFILSFPSVRLAVPSDADHFWA
jgi:hypothetical protein